MNAGDVIHPAGGALGPASSSDTQSIVERVWALESFGRPEEALAEVRRGLSEHPEDADLLGSLAWLEFFHGSRDQSEVAARQTLAARPDDWRGLTMLAENAVVAGELGEAEAAARRLRVTLPDSAASHLELAHVLAQPRKDGRKARKHRHGLVRESVATAVTLAPEHIDTLRRASILLAAAGDERGSAELLSRALALDPTNEQLLLLVATSHGTDEIAGLRVLTGVLTENPQQREAARNLSDIIWVRTGWIASFLLLVLVGLLLYGYLVFEEGIATSSRQRRQIGGVFVVAVMGWVMLLVFVRRALPRGYLRRLYNAVWWVWIGIACAAAGFLGTLFLAFAFGARSLPAQYKMAGGYIGGLTATLCFIAVIVLAAELFIVFARFASETRNRIFAGDDQGLIAARTELRGAVVVLMIRGAAAVVLALLPIFASGIATRPEAAGAFGAVAVAVGLPPLVNVLLTGALVAQAEIGSADRARKTQTGEPQTAYRPTGRFRRVWALLLGIALLLSASGISGAFALSMRHAAEHDPPPTPGEIEQRERMSNLRDSLDEFDQLGNLDFDQMLEDARLTTGGFQEQG